MKMIATIEIGELESKLMKIQINIKDIIFICISCMRVVHGKSINNCYGNSNQPCF